MKKGISIIPNTIPYFIPNNPQTPHEQCISNTPKHKTINNKLNMGGEIKMNTQQAISKRIQYLYNERGLALHALSILSAVSPSTLKNIIKGESKNPGTVLESF